MSIRRENEGNKKEMQYASSSPSFGVTKTYRIMIYYESDQGPLPLNKIMTKIIRNTCKEGKQQVWNVEAEEQVQLENGAFVNTRTEMYNARNGRTPKGFGLRAQTNISREISALPQAKSKDKVDHCQNAANCSNLSKQTRLPDFGLLI